MRRLLALVFVAVSCAVGASASPAAAACATDPVPRLATAPVVFTGVVQSSAGSPTPKNFLNWISQVTVDRVYKGSVTGNSVQVSTYQRVHGCGARQLTPGQRYLFEVSAAGDTWRVVGGKAGAQPTTDALLAQVQSTLGAGTAPSTAPPAPSTVGFDRVGTLHPHGLPRVAAPGIALTLVGVLGLLWVGVVRRRAH